ncbi:MAG TPA: OmpH family outer membrane protein [Vicinamibacterales bacterium]|nr:OmpH family outer membrane protein [Vicinamibacterales bacterium]
MRVLAFVLVLNTAVAVGMAQAQASQAPAPKPTAPAPKPAAPAPAQPAQAQLPPPPKPRFQEGLKYAWVNPQQVAAYSAVGKVAAEKINALRDQKTRELQDRQKTLQANQQRLERDGGVMNDQARAQLQAEIEKGQRDLQRLTEDAQQEMQTLAEQVEADFNRKLFPVIERVAGQKGVHFVFNGAQSGLIWAAQGMDLTAEVIQALDSPPPAAATTPAPTTPAAGAPAPAGAPTAPATTPR